MANTGAETVSAVLRQKKMRDSSKDNLCLCVQHFIYFTNHLSVKCKALKLQCFVFSLLRYSFFKIMHKKTTLLV